LFNRSFRLNRELDKKGETVQVRRIVKREAGQEEEEEENDEEISRHQSGPPQRLPVHPDVLDLFGSIFPKVKICFKFFSIFYCCCQN